MLCFNINDISCLHYKRRYHVCASLFVYFILFCPFLATIEALYFRRCFILPSVPAGYPPYNSLSPHPAPETDSCVRNGPVSYLDIPP